MLTIYPVTVEPEDREGIYKYHTDLSILANKQIQWQPTEDLLRILLCEHTFKFFKNWMGEKTNPSWIVMAVSERLYARDAISDEQFRVLNDDLYGDIHMLAKSIGLSLEDS